MTVWLVVVGSGVAAGQLAFAGACACIQRWGGEIMHGERRCPQLAIVVPDGHFFETDNGAAATTAHVVERIR